MAFGGDPLIAKLAALRWCNEVAQCSEAEMGVVESLRHDGL